MPSGITLAALLGAAIAAAADNTVLRVRDGSLLTLAQLAADAAGADVVFLGELHQRASDHERQLKIIEALHVAKVPLAVGLEMFRAESQKHLDSWVRGTLTVEEFLPRYYDNWSFPWPLYRPIFQFARDQRVPLVGLKISDRISRKVARSGFASLSPDERAHLPRGINCTVDRTYREFIRKVYQTHMRDEKLFLNFCEAQMVWDQAMASHIVEYLAGNPGKKLVVLAGIGHAWRRGVPEQVSNRSKLTSLVILPAVGRELDRNTVTALDADYLLLD